MHWLAFRRFWVVSVEAEAEAWLLRHGPHAYRLAGDRAIDAYCLGDLKEQERWHEIRAIILDRLAPDASVEEIQLLLGPGALDEAETQPPGSIFDRDTDSLF